MNIIFDIPTDDDVINIYQTYLSDGEPDSPTVPFEKLSVEEQNNVKEKYKKFMRTSRFDSQKVGWITVVDRSDTSTINLGFGLFQEFRGKRMMGQIIKAAISYIKDNYSNKKITAGARLENFPAIKSLENAGFKMVGTETMPPVEGWPGPVEYSIHEYSD